MCGILGAFGSIDNFSEKLFSRALGTLFHRGPDGGAVWRGNSAVLGHRRLAIIDLSEAGVQPMIDPETGLVIVFNGEIYNFRELKVELEAKGCQFRSNSDTEVLLKGYSVWGKDVLNRCNGMWAFAIWDPATEKAFIARDRFGVKPFYYSLSDRGLLFASEPKALHALDTALTEPNPSAVADFIVDSKIHLGERTFYKFISALPAAHYGVYDARDRILTSHRYWDYPESPQCNSELMRDQEQFSEIFVDAVRLRLRSDVPVGLTLSGGLDSTAVLAAAKHVSASPPHCYTSVYSRELRGEEAWAEIAAERAGTKVEPVEAALDDWLQTMNKIVRHMDSPGYSPAVVPLWSIMAKARQDYIPVLLEGQGADELLAGYSQYSAISVLEYLKSGEFWQFLKGINSMRRTFSLWWTIAWLARSSFPVTVARITRNQRLSLLRPEVVRIWRDRDEDHTLSRVGKSYDPLHAALWHDHAINVLPALLHYGDAISMAHGIESRLPFMDYRLVEWVFRELPILISEGQTKVPVRNFLRRHHFDRIANRKDKLGYPTPISEWYQRIGRKHLEQLTADDTAPIWGIMSRPAVLKLTQAAGSGSTRGLFHLYKVVTTDLWLKEIKSRAATVEAV